MVKVFAGRTFPLRAYGGVWAGQLRWGRLTHARVLEVLNNPCYAGAYVYGRYRSFRRVDPDGGIHGGTRVQSMNDWQVVIQEHHPGYIGWSEYLANRARLMANRTVTGARPPREGTALCQGILGCGSCGHPMTVRYLRNGHGYYECHSLTNGRATATCRAISADTIGEAVVHRLLTALTTAEIELAFTAADRVADDRGRGIQSRSGITLGSQTRSPDRKRLLRTLIADVTLLLPETDQAPPESGSAFKWCHGVVPGGDRGARSYIP